MIDNDYQDMVSNLSSHFVGLVLSNDVVYSSLTENTMPYLRKGFYTFDSTSVRINKVH